MNTLAKCVAAVLTVMTVMCILTPHISYVRPEAEWKACFANQRILEDVMHEYNRANPGAPIVTFDGAKTIPFLVAKGLLKSPVFRCRRPRRDRMPSDFSEYWYSFISPRHEVLTDQYRHASYDPTTKRLNIVCVEHGDERATPTH